MTSAYVNHEDIRQFLSNLRKVPWHSGMRMIEAVEHVSSCFGLRFLALQSRCRADPPVSATGLPLTTETLIALGELFAEHDMSVLKNTKRLELVAGAFGWKPDAFMHHLKSTTAGLGRNETMHPEYTAAPARTIRDLDSGRAVFQMLHALDLRKTGLFLIAGRTGSGKATTLRMTVDSLPKDKRIALLGPGIDFDDDQASPRDLRTLGNTLLTSPPEYIVMTKIRNHETAEFALRMSEHMVVLANIDGESPEAAARKFQHLAGRASAAGMIHFVFCQHLVRSAPSAKSYRTMVCALQAFDYSGSLDDFAVEPGSEHMFSIYADAEAKAARGEIEHEELRRAFGPEFDVFLERPKVMHKTTNTKVIMAHLAPYGSVEMSLEMPSEDASGFVS